MHCRCRKNNRGNNKIIEITINLYSDLYKAPEAKEDQEGITTMNEEPPEALVEEVEIALKGIQNRKAGRKDGTITEA